MAKKSKRKYGSKGKKRRLSAAQTYRPTAGAAPRTVVQGTRRRRTQPLKQHIPTEEELAEEYGDKVKIAKLNVDENSNIPAQMGIRGIPALFLFKNGEVVANKTGAAPKAALKSWIDGAI